MLNNSYIVALGVTGFIALVFLAIALALKMEKVKLLKAEVNQLKKLLDEMDEQTKLIVRTDIELNKAQEELDKKIVGLYALQKLTRAISTTLEENQIFKRIEPFHLEELGFEKACGFIWNNQENKFVLQLNIAYPQDGINLIQQHIDLNKTLYLDLIQQKKTISCLSLPDGLRQEIKSVFKSASCVISPLLPKEGDKGFLFVGTANTETALTAGDEESITILTNQIGQALENARLFEKTWHAHQELERKVGERTRELTLALDEVKKASKRKSDFVSSVSHELRTPLTSIKGYASILLAGKLGNLPPEAWERIAKINRHSDELTRLVNDLLDISRIESGRMAMKQEPQDLKNIIDEVLDVLSLQLKEKQIEFSLDLPKDNLVVFVDAGQIQRVFINIIGNAIKFTPAQGRISVHAQKRDKKVQVDITDTGCGIPKEALGAIFEEFYRVDNAINEQVKGTGLGLTLVKHIIEAHGGKIWVESKAGAGASFSFTLPLAV